MPDPVAQSQSFNANHRIDENDRVAYGYRDGGRHMQFSANGAPANVASREIIVVKSPQQDPSLQKAIDYAKANTAGMNTEQKANFLNKFVGRLLEQSNPATNEAIMDRIAGGNSVGAEISLGQLIDARTGVCRHRSLLFKVLADEVGVPTAVVRGNYIEPGASGGHAWNEVVLENKQRLIVDVMHDFVGDMNSRKAGYYADVNDNFLYNKGAQPVPPAQAPVQPVGAPAQALSKPEVRDVLRRDWQEADLQNGGSAMRMSTSGMSELQIQGLEETLRQNGMEPQRHYSETLGPVVRVTGADVDKFKSFQVRELNPAMTMPMASKLDWQAGELENGGRAARVPVNGMSGAEVEALKAQLRSEGLHPEEHNSASLGRVIRVFDGEAADVMIARQQAQSAPRVRVTVPEAQPSALGALDWQMGNRGGVSAARVSTAGMSEGQIAQAMNGLKREGYSPTRGPSGMFGGGDSIGLDGGEALDAYQARKAVLSAKPSTASQLEWRMGQKGDMAIARVSTSGMSEGQIAQAMDGLKREGYNPVRGPSGMFGGADSIGLDGEEAIGAYQARKMSPNIPQPVRSGTTQSFEIPAGLDETRGAKLATVQQPYQEPQAQPGATPQQVALQQQQLQEQQQRQAQLGQAAQSQPQQAQQQQAPVSDANSTPRGPQGNAAGRILEMAPPAGAQPLTQGNLALAPEIVPVPPAGKPFLVSSAPAAVPPVVTLPAAPQAAPIAIDTGRPVAAAPAAAPVIQAAPPAPVAASAIQAPPAEILAPAKPAIATAGIAGAAVVGEILPPERGMTPSQNAPDAPYKVIEGNAPSLHEAAAGHGVNGVMGAVGVATGISGFAEAHARGDHLGEGVSVLDTTVGAGNVATTAMRIAGKEAPAMLEGSMAKLGTAAIIADGVYQVYETKGPLAERDAAGKIVGVGARGEKAEEVAVNTGLTTVASMATTEALGGVVAANTAAAAAATEAGVAVGTFAAGGAAATVAIAAAPVVAAVAIGYAANKGIDNLKKEEVRSKAAFNEMAAGIRNKDAASEFKHGAIDLSGKPNIADYGELRAFEIAQRTRDGDGTAAHDKPGDYSKPENMAKLQAALTKEIAAQKAVAEAKSPSYLPSWMHSADETRVHAQMDVAHLEAAQKQLDKFKAETGDFNTKVAAQQRAADAPLQRHKARCMLPPP